MMAMADSGEAISALANRFINIYGRNGIVYGRNVTDFLSGISMSTGLLGRVTSLEDCPSQPESLLPLAWTRDNASHLVSTLLGGVQTPACYHQAASRIVAADEPDHGGHTEPSPLQVWGYGLLFVTLINLCAVLGIIFLPFMGRRVYKLLMTFMVSLAVGSLVATALLILLPDCLQLAFVHEEVNKENSSLIDHDHHHHLFGGKHSGHTSWEDFHSQHPWYLWRCCTVFGGAYFFFIIERLFKELIRLKGGGSGHGHSHMLPTRQSSTLTSFKTAEISPAPQDEEEKQETSSSAGEPAAYGAATVLPMDATTTENGGACCNNGAATPGLSVSSRLAKVQPVAWLILLGDAVHNFIDGLSIGAAFTRSTLSGISICLAVLCEELPHELGDFAILLSSGMSMPMALLCNFLSACTCYLGFALGVFLGETGASVWIFAIASGMFLYISLVDMVPEMNNSMEEPEARQMGRLKVFVLQNLGLFAGFGVILLLAVFGGNITVGE